MIMREIVVLYSLHLVHFYIIIIHYKKIHFLNIKIKNYVMNLFHIQLEKILKKKKSVYFAALLCYTFFKQSKTAPFCKLQIINYLPKIPEKNKLFPDVIIVPLSPKSTLDSIYNYILRKRKTKEQLWQIYSKYSLMSKLYSPENIDEYISYFDVTLSYLPYHLPISNLTVVSKSRQFEKIYLLITRNISDFHFSFTIDETYQYFSNEFCKLLI